MRDEALSDGSAWTRAQVDEFLERYRAPLRMAVNGDTGHPLLCSLWFRYEAGRLLCATKRDAKLARRLAADSRCAFELAPNEPPYFGVRGRGRATIRSEGAATLLGELIDRYLGDRDSSLAAWLLRNAADEVALDIRIEWMTAWDYRERMGGSADASVPVSEASNASTRSTTSGASGFVRGE